MGVLGTDYFGNTVTNKGRGAGPQFSALLGKIDFMDLNAAGMGLVGEAHYTGGHPFSDEANPAWGSFLVWPVGAKCKDKD
jgi:hypothetical protein